MKVFVWFLMERWQSGRMRRIANPLYWVYPVSRVQIPLSPHAIQSTIHGEVAEWSNASVLKTEVPQGTQGSNPCLSAFGSPKRTYGVTMSARKTVRVGDLRPLRTRCPNYYSQVAVLLLRAAPLPLFLLSRALLIFHTTLQWSIIFFEHHVGNHEQVPYAKIVKLYQWPLCVLQRWVGVVDLSFS